MKKTLLRNYAKTLAVSGLHIKKGDPVLISAGLDQPEFVEMVVEECYRAGASSVTVDWHHQPLQKINVKHKSLKELSKVEEWEKAKLAHYVEKLPASLYLISEDPDGLKGMNQKKYGKAMQARYPIVKPYRDQMENKYKWCVAAVPGKAWAKKMFPELRPSAAVEKLWEVILYTVHVTKGIGGEMQDGIAAWDRHDEDFKRRCEYLNTLDIISLDLKASNGTDLHVGLLDNSQFCGGGEYTLQGEWFNANMPTEEVFTSPKKGDADGIVYSSKPLSYRGQLIDKFWVKFEGGKAVDVHAEQNEDLLYADEVVTQEELLEVILIGILFIGVFDLEIYLVDEKLVCLYECENAVGHCKLLESGGEFVLTAVLVNEYVALDVHSRLDGIVVPAETVVASE